MKRYIALLALLLLFSCISDRISIKETNIPNTNVVQEHQNILMKFNRDLVPDSLVNKWDTTSYAKITPAVKGSFQWTGKNELSFSPHEGFEPNTDYTIELTDNILKHGDKNLGLSDDKTIKFHTDYFRMENVTMKWHSTDSISVIPGLEMTMFFNYKIRTDVLDTLLEVSINDRNYPVRVQTGEADEKVTVSIRTDDAKNLANESVKIRLKKGLSIIGARNKTDRDYTAETTVPTNDKLLIEGVSASNDVNDLNISVMTNQELARDQNLKNFIKINPEIEFTVDQNEFGFNINAAFDPTVTYDLTILGSLRGIMGRPLTDDYKASVSFNQLEPMIQFSAQKAMYLTSKGNKNVGIKIFGTNSINVTVVKVYENNILAFTQKDKSWAYAEEDDEWHDYQTYETDDVGDVIFRKTYETKSLPRNSGIYLLNLDFKDVIRNYDGVYVVKVESNEKKWLQDSRIISISDIGLVVKKAENQLLVFANSIKTGEALPGTKIKLISSNNQPFANKETDVDGIAVFNLDENSFPKFIPRLISARSGDDINYMLLDSKTMVDNSKFKDISGISGKDYKTFLYGDRDLYRPDDTLTIAGIIRDENWKTLGDVYIKVELLMPNSKVFKEMKVLLNSQGGFSERVYLPGSMVTGIYSIRVSLLNGTVLKTRRINIEDFMPDRIKVNIMSNKDSYGFNDSIYVTASVYNLFGPPAANRKYDFSVDFVKRDFKAKDFPKYDFSIKSSSDKHLSIKERSGRTNSEGKLWETVGIPQEMKDMGLLQASTDLTVFDETNRTVSRNLKLDVFTQDVFVGICDFDDYVGTGKRVVIPVVAVDRKGSIVYGHPVRVRIIKKEWETVMRSNSGRNYMFESQKVEKIVSEKDEVIKGANYTIGYRPNQSGEYEIRIYNPGAETYVSHEFYSYTWGGAQANSFEVNTEGTVDITLDKPSYQVGEKATVLFKTPFQGKLLVTLERNGIIEHRILKTDNRAAELVLPIKREYLPNIYISATLIKALSSEEIPLTIAYGYAPLMVEEQSNKLPVKIIAEEKSRSNRTQKVTIQTLPKKDIFVTIAAVDEGILQVKNYKTPDPYNFFYQKIGLGMSTYSLYPYLFPDLRIQSFRYGAGDDDDYNLQKRLNPLTSKRVHLISYWSGVLKTNSSGKVTYEFEIPEFSGANRIMACAYYNDAFGSSESMLTVSDPVVLSAALPRFLSPGDYMESVFTLSNTTRNKETVKTRITYNGPLKLLTNEYDHVTIEPNTEKQVYFKLQALNQAGESKVVILAEAGGEKYTQTTELAVRPAATLQKTDISGIIEPNSMQKFSLPGNFYKESISSQYIVSKSPMIEFSRDLKYLIEYPYGCVEQTVSTAFPQLAVVDILNMLGKPGSRYYINNAALNIRFAIDKLQSMQLPQGGLSFWQGGTEESWWGTAYAAHFLLECRKAGYEINSSVFERMLRYLAMKTVNDKPGNYYWWENGKTASKQVYSRESAYSLFVLALAGRPEISHMNFLKSKPEMLTNDSKFMLAAAYKLAGGRQNNNLAANYQFVSSVKETGGSFSTPVRDLAIAIYTLQISDPSNWQIPRLIQHLVNSLKKEKYLSTQDRSFSLLAIANSAKENMNQQTRADIYSDGKKYKQMTPENRYMKETYGSQEISVKNTGSGRLYYFAEREGIPTGGTNKEGDNFIKVRRRYFTRDGKEITNGKFRQGEMILVKITLESMYNENVDNIAVTDLLPAGFEIENPRLNNQKIYDWIKDASEPEHFDYRDDRINIFCSLQKVESSEQNKEKKSLKSFYYMVRAVTKGQFTSGSVAADAMYNGEYHSYSGAGKVVVE